MNRSLLTLILLVGLGYGLAVLAFGVSGWRLPDNQRGYAPAQPVAYSHRLHAGELGIACRFCHSAVDRGRHAGIPAADVCMKCHSFVAASFDVQQAETKRAEEEGRKPDTIVSDELRRLYDALGIEDPKAPLTEEQARSIPWVRVHDLPDYACFDHSAHTAAGVSCQKCHGPVETMERVRQIESLSMGWCVNCHREATRDGVEGRPVHATLNCSACHH